MAEATTTIPTNTYERLVGGATREGFAKAVHLLDPLDAASVLHDNAAGTGLTTGVILAHQAARGLPAPTIHATDNSESMLENLRRRFPDDGSSSVRVRDVSSCALDGFADGMFTHSVTAFALALFSDQAAGAREIYRTLRPGGVALVTSWITVPHLEFVRRVQLAARPDDEPDAMPVPPEWFEAETHARVLREAGFREDQIGVTEETAHWGAPGGAGELWELLEWMLVRRAEGLKRAYTEEEKGRLREAGQRILREEAKAITREDGTEWTTLECAIMILVCKK